MKRSICAVSLLSVLTLTACGGGSGGGNSASPADSASASGRPNTTTVVSSDGNSQTIPASVDVPAAGDSYTLTANETLDVPPEEGVMSNDLVEDPQFAQVGVVAEPANGSLVLELDGSFTYTPDHGFAGIDNFSYTLLDENGEETEAKVTITVAESGADNGFTPIVPSSDTVTVYVSSSQGLDSNDGLSIGAPVKTLEKAFSLTREGYPDHVLLKRGDVWVDEDINGIKSGRSKDEPAVVAFYGQNGARPQLKVSSYTVNIHERPLHYVNIMGLSIEAYRLNPEDPAFDGESSGNIRLIGDLQSVLFEDLKLRFVEFIIQGNPNTGAWARDVTIRRSIVLDKYSGGTSYDRDSRPSGIYTDTGDGLVIEDSVWDHNGWNRDVHGAGSNMYNHNMYISDKANVGNNIVVRNNIITRASSHGVHGRPGGHYENNFFARNAVSLQMGYIRGPALAAGTKAHAIDNVITEGKHMNRGTSDSCADPALCTGAIWGLWLENLGEADVKVEGNIASERFATDMEIFAKGIKDDLESVQYSNNISYKWATDDEGVSQSYPDPGRTAADYNATLGGEASFEAFIDVVRNRPLQTWDERYTADAVNDYIREGFGIKE